MNANAKSGIGPKIAAAHIHGFGDFDLSLAMFLAMKTQSALARRSAVVARVMGFSVLCLSDSHIDLALSGGSAIASNWRFRFEKFAEVNSVLISRA
jgi:hypothetical protein